MSSSKPKIGKKDLLKLGKDEVVLIPRTRLLQISKVEVVRALMTGLSSAESGWEE
jgi:hypothetical protein